MLLGGCDDLSRPALGPAHSRFGRDADPRHPARDPLAVRRWRANISEADISRDFKANGTTESDDADYKAHVAEWLRRLEAQGRRPGRAAARLSLAELRAMPSRTQITRHDCVEGWSCIGKWKGVPLSALLEQAKLKPEARYIVFYCADDLGETGTDGTANTTSRIGLVDAFHPQTILAYEMNGADPARPARRAAAAPRRAPARLQDGEIRDADRSGRRASPASAAAAAASGKTAATSGTPGSDAGKKEGTRGRSAGPGND